MKGRRRIIIATVGRKRKKGRKEEILSKNEEGQDHSSHGEGRNGEERNEGKGEDMVRKECYEGNRDRKRKEKENGKKEGKKVVEEVRREE